MTEIESFIKQFKEYDQADVLRDTFRRGQCYWFAYILKGRFPAGRILYEPVEGHFVFRLDGRTYDITGDITGDYAVGQCFWSEYAALDRPSILYGCVLKKDPAAPANIDTLSSDDNLSTTGYV